MGRVSGNGKQAKEVRVWGDGGEGGTFYKTCSGMDCVDCQELRRWWVKVIHE